MGPTQTTGWSKGRLSQPRAKKEKYSRITEQRARTHANSRSCARAHSAHGATHAPSDSLVWRRGSLVSTCVICPCLIDTVCVCARALIEGHHPIIYECSLSRRHAHTYARTHARTRARAHTHTHTNYERSSRRELKRQYKVEEVDGERRRKHERYC